MSLTGALNDLIGDSLTGATGLLSGNTGTLIVFGGSIVVIGIVIGAFYYFTSFGKRR